MAKYLIQGGNKLSGKISISGNKNSILPCLAAAILTEDEVVLRNVPNISDVEVFSEILRGLGAEVTREEQTIRVRCQKLNNHQLPEELVSKIRASILFVGPILSRVGKVEFYHPGGDVIGKRSIDTHLESLHDLGFDFAISNRKYRGWKTKEKIHKAEIFLDEASVTATENLVLASVLGDLTVIVKNCASEPHVVDLCNLLVLMGANIEGVGTATLKISGVKFLHGAEFKIGSDYLEFGTYSIAAAITKGKIEIENVSLSDLEPITVHLKKMGLIFEENGNCVTVYAKKIKAMPHRLHTNIWPGFPSDLMSVAIVLATQAQGVSLLVDWMYESRMFFVDKLISMGAEVTIADPHRVVVSGPAKLYGRNMETPDIRAGMALVLASLVANGQSVINKAELIERGYEDVIKKLTSLNATIQSI